MTLIERLEGLTGPCRECDGLIAAAVGARHGPDGGWSNNHNGDYWTVKECAEPYTASIDAALALVPEGCIWNVGGNPNGGFASAGLFGAAIWQGIDQINGEAPTPAIALCIAALLAVQS